MSQYKECPRCKDHIDHGERCNCDSLIESDVVRNVEPPKSILLKFSDGNRVSTRINGTVESIVEYYRTNNRLSNPDPEAAGGPAPRVTLILFHDSGELITL